MYPKDCHPVAILSVPYYSQDPDAFTPSYLNELQGQILACPHFTVNNLNRDFVKTKGFSIAFRRTQISEVARIFPYFKRECCVRIKHFLSIISFSITIVLRLRFLNKMYMYQESLLPIPAIFFYNDKKV